jgi:hypothetical protein
VTRSWKAATGRFGRARVAVLATLALYAALLVARGGAAQWGHLGVKQHDGPRPFEDMRSLTSAWECAHRGVHVLPENPCDPWGRAFDYPRIWLLGSHLGLGQDATNALGILAAITFLVAVLLLVPRTESAVFGVVVGAALCSPAIMLGVERGNIDLVVFALVVAALLVLRRGTAGVWGATALLLLGTALKISPVFALLVLLRRGRTGLVALGASAVAVGTYALVTLGDVHSLSRILPQPGSAYFGVRRFTQWVAFVVGWSDPVRGDVRISATGARLLDIALVAILVAIALLVHRRWPLRTPGDDDEPAIQQRVDLFVGGAAIYVFSYATVQRFDYALVPLIATLPLLWLWARAGRSLAWMALAAMAGVLWLDVPWSGVPVLGTALQKWSAATDKATGAYLPLAAAAQVVLFATLVAGLAGALAPSVREQLASARMRRGVALRSARTDRPTA